MTATNFARFKESSAPVAGGWISPLNLAPKLTGPPQVFRERAQPQRKELQRRAPRSTACVIARCPFHLKPPAIHAIKPQAHTTDRIQSLFLPSEEKPCIVFPKGFEPRERAHVARDRRRGEWDLAGNLASKPRGHGSKSMSLSLSGNGSAWKVARNDGNASGLTPGKRQGKIGRSCSICRLMARESSNLTHFRTPKEPTRMTYHPPHSDSFSSSF